MRFLWALLAWGLAFHSTSWATPTVQDAEQAEVEQQDQGTKTLEEAFALMSSATDTRDFDRVADLCDQALQQGLSDKEKEQALSLQVSAWMAGAQAYYDRIFTPTPDRRWRIFRREAVSRLEKALAANPQLPTALLQLGRLNMLDGGDADRARESVEKAIELAGTDANLLSQALIARSEMAETDDERLSSLSQAVKVHPENAEAIYRRGLLYLKMEQFDEALEDYKRVFELQPDRVDAALLAVDVLVELDRGAEALEVLNAAIERRGDLAALYSKRASIHMSLEQQDQAIDDAEEALQIDQNNIDALYVRVNVQLDRKQYEEALSDIDRIIKLEPGSVRAIWTRSIVFASAKRYAESLRDLRVLTANAPEVDIFQLQLAAVLNADEQAEEALEIYNRILAEEPDNEQALRGRGDAYLTTGEHAKAIADYERCLEIDPDDDGVLNNLSWVLSTSPFDDLRDGQRAIELALKACEIREYKAAHILSTLASGYAEVGDFEKAREWATKAVELAEDDEQRGNLSKELESYKEDKPWREYQPDKKKEATPPSDSSERRSDKTDEGAGGVEP